MGGMFWPLTLLGLSCVALLIARAARSDRALLVFCVATAASMLLLAAVAASIEPGSWGGG